MTSPEPFSFVHFLRDTAGRAVSTLVQVTAVALIATGAPYTGAKVWAALLVGALAAVLSVGTSLVSVPFPSLRPGVITPYLDLALRTAKTFVQAFFATIIAQNALDVAQVHWAAALAVAVPAAGTAFLKGLLGVMDRTTSGAGVTVKGLAAVPAPFAKGL